MFTQIVEMSLPSYINEYRYFSFRVSIVLQFKLIQYPQSAPPPPIGDEIEKFRNKSAEK